MDVKRASSSSSSSSSFAPTWTYDVFLSFRGEDVRNTFVAHLDHALRQRKIKTYVDDMLRKGNDISSTLLKAIEKSRTSIIVFSENYASSRWCLEELMKILECKKTKQQIVLPVFYHVDPSEVRNQTNSYAKALADLQLRFKDCKTVQRWKEALSKVANLSGFHWQKERKESEFINEIVHQVSRIADCPCLNVAKFPTGIESRVQDIISLLSIEDDENVCMLGIFGIGGVGKTTIAKAVYNLIAYRFESSCFLPNIREISKRENGLAHVQETLLFEILGDSTLKVLNEDRGINEIKKRLYSEKILLILDDVDELNQLEKLVGACDWFGSGSRIIITTRDKHVLVEHEVGFCYEAKKLDHNEAFQLFSWHAFHQAKPPGDFVKVTKDILCYASGLPLVLTVLGSDLYGCDIHQWTSALKSYKRIPHQNIHKKLKISFDKLDDIEKDVFLDIACFFVGECADSVIKILDSCHLSIKKLMDKCLINVDLERLWVHDLLQDMGREIVRQESKEPGERSRLWFHEDIRHVLEDNTATNKIEGMLIELPEPDLISLSSEVFRKMTRLRIFINRNARFSRGPNFLSNELRALDWPQYPLQSLPANFRGEKLIVLNMSGSPIKEFVRAGFKNLTSMDFRNCKFLKVIPDLSRSENLARLLLDHCTNLVQVHPSIGFLQTLQVLSLSACSRLSYFPMRLKAPSLGELNLDGCLSLEYFPEIECEMKEIRSLDLGGNGARELPSSFGRLTGLARLCLTKCKNLIYLPSSICQLQNLAYLSLYGCPNPIMLGKEEEDNTKSMTSAASSSVKLLPRQSLETYVLQPHRGRRVKLAALPSLETFVLQSRRESLSNFLMSFNCSSKDFELDLSRSDIVSLPSSIGRFFGLKTLRLSYCDNLQEIPELPPNIQEVYASGCKSLKSFPEVSKKFKFKTSDLCKLRWVDLSGCCKMLVEVGNSVPWGIHDHPHGIIFPGDKIPDFFRYYEEDLHVFSYDINVDRQCLRGIRGIFLCVVINGTSQLRRPAFRMLGRGFRWCGVSRELDLMGSDHVWLEYLELLPYEEWCFKNENEQLDGDPYLRIHIYGENSDSFVFKSFGIHMLHQYEAKGDNDYQRGLDDHVDVRFGRRPIKKLSMLRKG